MQNEEMSETNKYAPYKTWVRIFKVSWDKNGKKTKSAWFKGLVSSVLSRGLMVIPFDEKPMGECLDSNAAGFVPFNFVKNDIEIEVDGRRN